MQVRILGKRWGFRYTPNLSKRGDIDHPHVKNKEIRVLSTLKGEERLEVTIHEIIHGAGWHFDEDFVEELGCDLARILWRLGYRQRGCDDDA